MSLGLRPQLIIEDCLNYSLVMKKQDDSDVFVSRVYCITLAVVFFVAGVAVVRAALGNLFVLAMGAMIIVTGIFFLVAGFFAGDRVVFKISAFGGTHWLFIPIVIFSIFVGSLLSGVIRNR